ncbi:hypothetical protein PFDSM3638_07670 [Pyrococcus furiosus DSM 3638]|uniref:Uncharacterized protein n=3 Tax=Pyrococcus furiosus TaxID=2261 RepID=A0A5C0XUX9_PYRFU|nr:hypothetical protein PF1523 [Pyrococcus furiosus DSM 3638]MDK2869031.1 hypothetical protein [Pyrococcus sp.]QEK79714.1 hypothetical protein PFDSM3638_07670 [Pyrococcus furiosus DSM 3638]
MTIILSSLFLAGTLGVITFLASHPLEMTFLSFGVSKGEEETKTCAVNIKLITIPIAGEYLIKGENVTVVTYEGTHKGRFSTNLRGAVLMVVQSLNSKATVKLLPKVKFPTPHVALIIIIGVVGGYVFRVLERK